MDMLMEKEKCNVLRKQVIIITCDQLMKSSDMQTLEDAIRKGLEEGLVILPSYCKVTTADRDCIAIGG